MFVFLTGRYGSHLLVLKIDRTWHLDKSVKKGYFSGLIAVNDC